MCRTCDTPSEAILREAAALRDLCWVHSHNNAATVCAAIVAYMQDEMNANSVLQGKHSYRDRLWISANRRWVVRKQADALLKAIRDEHFATGSEHERRPRVQIAGAEDHVAWPSKLYFDRALKSISCQ